MENGGDAQQASSKGPTDQMATKFVQKSEDVQEKVSKRLPNHQEAEGAKSGNKKPAGGFDGTPIPQEPPGFTLKFTFHRATNLPMADLNSFSSDPFVVARLDTSIPSRHKHDSPLRFRSPTQRRTVEPQWSCDWTVANVPSSGFDLKVRIYDEDPMDHDDRLGNVRVPVNSISEDWEGIKECPYTIKKRSGSKRAYLILGIASFFSRDAHMTGQIYISVENLGRTENENGGHLFTVGPNHWSQHFSPMIGRITGTKEPGKGKKKGTQRYKQVMKALI